LLPVTFDRRYEPYYDVDFERELHKQLRSALQRNGYAVVAAENGGRYGAPAPTAAAAAGADAGLAVHVDYLIISDYNGGNPPPMIDVEAEARLLREGRELWRDRGQARLGGTGGMVLLYPAADLALVLDTLAERLLTTLPPAGGR
jgi:hypothetical protein